MRKIKVDYLKKYVEFLYHNQLSEVIEFYHQENTQGISVYHQLSEEEHTVLFLREIDFYFKSILDDTIANEINEWTSDLKSGKLYEFFSTKLDASFFRTILHSRKIALIYLLSKYSGEVNVAVSVLKDLESLSKVQEGLVNDFFSEQQQQKDLKILTKEKQDLEKALFRMEKILRYTPTHINVYDIDKDQVVYNNGAGYKIFKHSPEKVMAAKFSEYWNSVVHADDKKKVKARIKNFKNLKDDELDQLEYRLIGANGNTIWFYSRATVFKRENGKVKQVLLNALNITELKKIEEERRYVESQLEEAQRIAHIGSYDWDMVKDILLYTEEAYRIYDFPSEKKQFKISDFKSRLKLEDVSEFENNLEKAFQDKNSRYEGEYRIVLSDKTEKDIISRAKIIRDESGKPIRMKGTVMDITSIKKAEYKLREKNKEIVEINQRLEASQEEIRKINLELEDRIKSRTKELRKSEELYRLLAENVPHLFWTTHAEGGIDFYNNNVYKYTGATFDELKEWKWESIIHPDDLQSVLEDRKKSLDKGVIYEKEVRLRRKDGVYRWHLSRSVPLKDKEGKIYKWMGSATDIDEQKKYLNELKEKNKQLVKTNKDLDNFIYTASHDLKAPISNIEGLLDALNIELGNECISRGDNSAILGMIDSSVSKFKETILDLTEITIAQKSGEEEVQDNNIHEVFDEVKETVNDLIETSGAKIETDFESCPIIKFSKKNLKSILYNLLSNAIKFRSDKRRAEVDVKTQCLDDYIVLSVKDNGLGFDPSQKSKVFEMFKRLHSHTEGTGVGLYLVKRIIANAGGKIEVESEKDKGALFKVFFKN